FTLLRMAIKANLLMIAILNALDMNCTACRRLNGYSCFQLELPCPLTAHHQIAVTLFAQPKQVSVSCDTCIHHHQCTRRRTQVAGHVGQRLTLCRMARECLRPSYETAAIEYQPQGPQWTIITFSF